MRVSIAMTTYNGIKYISELLDSIKSQLLQPDEVVIVDDCSTDGTYEFVLDYKDKHELNDWKVYQNDVNRGWKANFREAFKHCTGDIVFLCDQDDIWENYKIHEMTNVMKMNSHIQLLVSNYSVIDVDREEKVKILGLNKDDASVEKLNFKYSSLNVLRPGCTYCARRNLIDQMWNRDMISAPHDAILWAYAAINDSLFLFNRKTIRFRRHSDSASSPLRSLCRTRRIEEISYMIGINSFFKEECEKRGYENKTKMVNKQLKFENKRKKILESQSLIGMILFQLRNWKYYPTLRNMLSDDYVLLLHTE